MAALQATFEDDVDLWLRKRSPSTFMGRKKAEPTQPAAASHLVTSALAAAGGLAAAGSVAFVFAAATSAGESSSDYYTVPPPPSMPASSSSPMPSTPVPIISWDEADALRDFARIAQAAWTQHQSPVLIRGVPLTECRHS